MESTAGAGAGVGVGVGVTGGSLTVIDDDVAPDRPPASTAVTETL
jgi:hypothetical protein